MAPFCKPNRVARRSKLLTANSTRYAALQNAPRNTSATRTFAFRSLQVRAHDRAHRAHRRHAGGGSPAASCGRSGVERRSCQYETFSTPTTRSSSQPFRAARNRQFASYMRRRFDAACDPKRSPSATCDRGNPICPPVNTAFCFGCRTPNYSHQVHAFEVILQLVEVIR